MLQSHSMLCLGEIGISRSLGVALCIVAKHLMVQQGSKCWSWVVERELPWQSQENICNRNYVMVCGPGEDGQRGERIPKGGKKGKGKAGTSQMWRDFYCQIAPFPMDGEGEGQRWWQVSRWKAPVASHGFSALQLFSIVAGVNMSMCEVAYFHIYSLLKIETFRSIRVFEPFRSLNCQALINIGKKEGWLLPLLLHHLWSHTIPSHTPEILCR